MRSRAAAGFGNAGRASLVAAVFAAWQPALADAPSAGDEVPAEEADLLTQEIIALTGDPAYGEYLGGECVTCHQQSGASGGIPPIVGLPADHTVRALVEYRLGIRTNEVMRLMAARLGNEEIAALAAYFASREPK